MKKITGAPDETRQLAAKFAKQLPHAAVVGLIGPLGAGKTVFVQGMAEGLDIDPESYVTSPTFALIHEYGEEGAPKLIHFDLYRLNHFEELIDIGFEDYTQRSGICVLEWADRFPELRDWLTHRVEFEIVNEMARRITIS